MNNTSSFCKEVCLNTCITVKWGLYKYKEVELKSKELLQSETALTYIYNHPNSIETCEMY